MKREGKRGRKRAAWGVAGRDQRGRGRGRSTLCREGGADEVEVRLAAPESRA